MAKHPSFEGISDTRRATLEALRYIKKAGPPDNKAGICFNVETLIGWRRPTDGLNAAAERWPDHSGSDAYPVPAPPGREYSPRLFYEVSSRQENGLWRRSQYYGRKRWELLDFLIQRYESMIEEK